MSGWIFHNGDRQPINLTKFVERVIEPTLEAKGVAFKTLCGRRRAFDRILRELTGASVAGRDALGHVSTVTTEARDEKAVPEAVLKGMRLLEEKATKCVVPAGCDTFTTVLATRFSLAPRMSFGARTMR